MTRILVVLAFAAAFGACELPTEQTPDNPFDPLYDGLQTPDAPTDLRLAGADALSVTLAWEDQSDLETGYRVERLTEGDPRSVFEEIAMLGPNATSFTDGPLRTSETRRYRVTALAGAGLSLSSNVVAMAYPYEVVPGRDAHRVGLRPGDDLVAVWDEEGFRLLDARTFAVSWSLPFDGGAFAFSPDGAFLALGGDGIRVYRVSDGVLLHHLLVPVVEGDRNHTVSLTFSPDGTYIAGVGGRYGVRVWNWEEEGVTAEFGALDTYGYYAHALFLGGGDLVTSRDGLTVWDAATGEPLRSFGSPGAGGALALDPEGRQVAAVTGNGVEVWDAEAGVLLFRLPALGGGSGDHHFVEFGGGGDLLAVAGAYRVRVYALPDRSLLREFAVPPSMASFDFQDVALSADGQTLVAGNASSSSPNPGAARVWRLDAPWEALPPP